MGMNVISDLFSIYILILLISFLFTVVSEPS